MGTRRTLRLCALYPEKLNIYADRGNLMVLRRRCQMRGIELQVTAVDIDETIEPEAHDFFYIGGGQDRDQQLVAEDLRGVKGDALGRAAEQQKVMLAVCGGYQLLGDYYELGDRRIEGVGLLGLRTVRERGPRLIGNVTIELEVGGIKKQLSGFENHGGRTYLTSPTTPLGRVVVGHGNNGSDGFEGAVSNNVFGTYLHGPLLPKNVWFADHLISLALDDDLPEPDVDDRLEDAVHRAAINVASENSRTFGGLFRRRRQG